MNTIAAPHYLKPIIRGVVSIKSHLRLTIVVKILFWLVASYISALHMSMSNFVPVNWKIYSYCLMLWAFWLAAEIAFGARVIRFIKSHSIWQNTAFIITTFVVSVTAFVAWDVFIWTEMISRQNFWLNLSFAISSATTVYLWYGFVVLFVFSLITVISRLSDRLANISEMIHTKDATPSKEVKQKEPDFEKIAVASTGKTDYVSVENIIRIEAKSYYANLVLKDSSFLIRESLESLINRLRPSGFRRIHRSHIVNIVYVDRIIRKSKNASVAVLRNGDSVPISRTRHTELKKLLESKSERALSN